MERPLLVTADLIKPIQSGLKTETRRLAGLDQINEDPDKWFLIDTGIVDGNFFCAVFEWGKAQSIVSCPYGKPGDVLWIRENWYTLKGYDKIKPNLLPVYVHYAYQADGAKSDDFGKTRPSIHMPRSFSRISIEILSIYVERLHDITEESAKAEGVVKLPNGRWKHYAFNHDVYDLPMALHSFDSLWIKLNGLASWQDNPWVWVLKFKKVNA